MQMEMPWDSEAGDDSLASAALIGKEAPYTCLCPWVQVLCIPICLSSWEVVHRCGIWAVFQPADGKEQGPLTGSWRRGSVTTFHQFQCPVKLHAEVCAGVLQRSATIGLYLSSVYFSSISHLLLYAGVTSWADCIRVKDFLRMFIHAQLMPFDR